MGVKLKERARVFYKKHLDHWKTIGEGFPKWIYSSDPAYRGHTDLLAAFYRSLPGPRILGAGCGPMARDLRFLARRGCKPVGIDLVPENIESARRVTTEDVTYEVVDMTEPLPFRASTFHGVLCIAVIQYMTRPALTDAFFPSVARVLAMGGLLLLVFKKGKGIHRVLDIKLGVHRHFRLYEPTDIIKMVRRLHLSPIQFSPQSESPWIDFKDERGILHSALLLKKSP